MTRLTIIIFAFCFLGLTKTNKQPVAFLFYDLPLDKNTRAINDKILQDKNFKLISSERSLFHVRNVQAKIEKPNTFTNFADSVSFNMSLLSSFYYGNKSKEDPILKTLELTLYFKKSNLKKAEFDTLEKVFAKNYKFKHLTNSILYCDGPGGKDTIPEVGKEYSISDKNKYPKIGLYKNTTDGKHCYIKLVYTDLN